MRNLIRPVTFLLGCLAVLTLASTAHGRDDLARDNVVVLLDTSGSMREAMGRTRTMKLDAAREALKLVLQGLPDTTNVGVLVFGQGRNRWIVPLGPLDRDTIDSRLQRIGAGGRTPLGEFMKVASDRLLEQRELQKGYGTFRLLVLTDGEASDQRLLDQYLPDILSRGLTIDAIGVDMPDTHDLARSVHSYRSADDPKALTQAVTEVFAEVGSGTDDIADDAFEVVAALPSDLALAMLTAMTESGNEPIGVRRDLRSDRELLDAHATNTSGNAAQKPADPNGVPGASKSKLSPFMIFILIVTFMLIVRAVKRAGGGR